MDLNNHRFKVKTQSRGFRGIPLHTLGHVGHMEIRSEHPESPNRYIVITDTHFGIHNNSKNVLADSLDNLYEIITNTILDELYSWYIRQITGTKKWSDDMFDTQYIDDENERREAVLKVMYKALTMDQLNVPTLSFHLVHCGDLFDSRTSVNVETASLVFKFLCELASQYFIINGRKIQYLIESFTFIGGNHDYANNNDNNHSAADFILSRANQFCYQLAARDRVPGRSYKLDYVKFNRFNVITKDAYITNYLYNKYHNDYLVKINEECPEIMDSEDDFEGDTILVSGRANYKQRMAKDMRRQCMVQHVFIPWLGTTENKTPVDDFLINEETEGLTQKIENRYEEHLSKCMSALHSCWSHYYKEERESFYKKQQKDIKRIEKAVHVTIPKKTKLRHAIILFCHLDIFGKYDVNHNHIEPLLKAIQKYPELWTGEFPQDKELNIERELEILIVSGHIHGPRQLFNKQGVPKHIKFLNLGSSLYHTFNDTDDKFLHIFGLDPEAPRDGPLISIQPIPMNKCIRYHNLYGIEGLHQLENGKRKDGKTDIKTKDYIRWYLTAQHMSEHLNTIKQLRTEYPKLEILPYSGNIGDNENSPDNFDVSNEPFTFDINHLSEYLPEHLRDLYNQYALQ